MRIPLPCCVWALALAPLLAVESVLEDFASAADLRLGGQLLQTESSLRFFAGPAGGREAFLAFRFVPVTNGIPTVSIVFPPKSRTVFLPAHRLLVAVHGDRAGVPLRVTLLDRSDELHMYQLEPTDRHGPGGSVIYAAAIDQPGFFCWGGDANKQPDYPLSLDQLFLDGNGTSGAGGTVSFASISSEGEQENKPAKTGKTDLVASFSAADSVQLGGEHVDPASRLTVAAVAPFPHAAKLHFRLPAPVPHGGQTCGVHFVAVPILNGPLRQLLIPVRGDAGQLPVRINVLDAHDELHMFTCEPAVAGTPPEGFRWLAVDFSKPPLFIAGGDGDRILQWPARLDLVFIDGGSSPGVEGDLVVGPIQAVPGGGL